MERRHKYQGLLSSPFPLPLADTPDTSHGILGWQLPGSSHCLPVSLPTVTHGSGVHPCLADSSMTEPETVALHWWDPETIHSLLRMVFLCQMIQPEQDLWIGYRKDSHNQRTPASLWAPEPNIRSDESVTHPESLQCSSSQLFTLAWEAETSSCCWPSASRRARPPTSQSLLTFQSISSKSTWLDQAL